jgi:hypothetical protein
MVKIVATLLALLLALAQARAEDGLEVAMGDDPERFAEMVTDLIAGFGVAGNLRAEGIEEHIALERAAARATALRRFLAMDLDGDGTVDRSELEVSQRAASASMRGKLERQFKAADRDGSDQIDLAELRAEGQAAALRALGEAEAETLRALITLDANGDGALQIGEVRLATARTDEAT